MDFDMGKYGLFVWGAYGLSAIGLISLTALSLLARREKARALVDLTEALKARQQDEPAGSPAPVSEKPANERSA